MPIIGRESHKTHRRGSHTADASTLGVFLTDGARDDLLEIHAHLVKKVLRQVAAMEAHGFIRIVPVVVVPIEQRARRFGRELQGVHADHATDIDFARTRHQIIAHHTHHGTGDHAEEVLDRSPALDGADTAIGLDHPFVNHSSQLRHFQQGASRHAAGRNVFLNFVQLLPRGGVVVANTLDAPEDFGEVDGFDGDAVPPATFRCSGLC